MKTEKTAVSGKVAVSSVPEYRKTLMVDMTRFVGNTEQVSYQWFRNGAAIIGETSGVYTVTHEDIGKIIKIVVTGTGDYKGELKASVQIMAYIRGDANGDLAEPNVLDVLQIIRHVNGTNTLTGTCLTAAELTADGKVDISDVLRLLSYITGNISSLS